MNEDVTRRPMAPKYGTRYWKSLYATRDLGQSAELSGLLCSCSAFKHAEADYGLPRPAFLFVEYLLWSSQGIRSGIWTYYEATPLARQSALLAALSNDGPVDDADYHRRGMQDWRDSGKIRLVDQWIKNYEEDILARLWSLAEKHRGLFEQMCG